MAKLNLLFFVFFSLISSGNIALADAELTVFPEQPSPGEFFLIKAKGLGPAGRVTVDFEGKTYDLWKNGDSDEWDGLASVDRDSKLGVKKLKLMTGETQTLVLNLPLKERVFPEQHISVSEKMVTLSPEDQKRANREAVQIRKSLKTFTPAKLWADKFSMPVKGRISGEFGVRRIYNGKPKSYHSGLDIAVPAGVPVHAAAAGTVSLVGDFFYTGNTVFVDHGFGLFTAYFHMSAISVAQGEKIKSGEQIGLVGATGRSTGPHLHWGTYLLGQKADPLSLIYATGGEVP